MTSAPDHSSDRNERVFLIALIVTAVLIRLFRIGAQSLWVDEVLTLEVSCPKEGLNIWSYLKFNIHGPLHSLAVYLFQLVSTHDGWLRVPGALAGVGAVVYFYLWVRSWLNRNVARIGAVLLAIHPLHLYYSQELRNYSFLFLFAMMGCYYFERMLAGESRTARVGYVVSIACAALSNFTAAFLFATHTILYFMRRGIRWKVVWRWAVLSLVILVLVSPWIYRIYRFVDVSALVTPIRPGQLSATERLRGETTFTAIAVPYAFYVYSVGFSLGPSTRELHVDNNIGYVLRHHGATVGWVAALFGGLFAWGVWKSVRKPARGQVHRPAPWRELLLYLLVPLIFTFVLNWQNAKVFNVRYVLLGYPAFVCFLAIGLDALPRRFSFAMTTVVLATFLISDGNYYFDGRYAREDVRGAVRYVEERIEPDECFFAPSVNGVVMHYYQGYEEVYAVFNPPGQTRDRVDTKLERMFAGCNSFWYIRARTWVDDRDGYVLERVEERYRQTELVYFDGVELFHFVAKNEGD
jgi:4-amino-4-deoxy-L-arabinose transferase-like glycosyltransferase